MNRSRVVALLGVAAAMAALGLFACVSKAGADPASVVVSTSPPLVDCRVLGRVDGRATELDAKTAVARAQDDLRKEAIALGGNYVVVTTQVERPVDMQLQVNDVKLQGRAYACPSQGLALGATPTGSATAAGSTWSVPAAPLATTRASSTDAGVGPGGPGAVQCPQGAEARMSAPPDEPGQECGLREAGRFVMHGPYVRYWPNGTVKTDGAFERGKRTGTWKTFDTSGQLREERTFHEGELEGRTRAWDSGGSLTSDRWYRGGVPVDAGRQ